MSLVLGAASADALAAGVVAPDVLEVMPAELAVIDDVVVRPAEPDVLDDEVVEPDVLVVGAHPDLGLVLGAALADALDAGVVCA